MKYGFTRVCCAIPHCSVSDFEKNATEIVALAKKAADFGAEIIVFPELCITAYTCSDLFLQSTLLEASKNALLKIANETKDISAVILVGLPLNIKNALFNVAAALHKGKVLALFPKSFVPNYAEFYEKRHFRAFDDEREQTKSIFLSEENPNVLFGSDIVIEDENDERVRLFVEICEDLWVPLSPSTKAALFGATIIANLSASNEIVGKAEYRRLLVKSTSARLCASYMYANAGSGESTTDLVFSGHSIIAENGAILAESNPFEEKMIFSDIDVEKITNERVKTTTFQDCAERNAKSFRVIKIPFTISKKEPENLLRFVSPHPFVPKDKNERTQRCNAIIEMQSRALSKRLSHTNAKSLVVGLSGGLDSTLALLVCSRAADILGLQRNQILCVTMPCFGTTSRTLKNAKDLSAQIGASLLEIDIKKAVEQHFCDIQQDENTHDATYENAQARERTQVLMDLANKTGGIVIGTGDLSESALGWATYNGDHISMYAVNASIPKTLVRHLVDFFALDAKNKSNDSLSNVLKDILETPVSPELLPPDKDGKIAQKTELLVGPYDLHDFFIYYALRFGFSPKKIFFLAQKAFENTYEKSEIKKWLISFYKRFFAQQFKRSCMPDGVKVGTVSLSPRGDWRMPSDAVGNSWINEAEACEC